MNGMINLVESFCIFIIFLPYFAEYILSLIFNKKKDNKFTLFLKKRFDLDVNSNIKYLFCGHIHTGLHSEELIGNTKCYNVSLKDENYKLSFPYKVLEI